MSGAWLTHPCPGWPVSQWYGVNRQFYPPFTLRNGQRWPGGHEGLDIACIKGTPVRAAHDGVIAEATRVPAIKRLTRKTQPPYGENARIETTQDGKRITTIYGHLDRLASWVRPGAEVKAGEVIGWSGNTGRVMGDQTKGYHLHLGVNIDGWPVDPAPLISGGVD